MTSPQERSYNVRPNGKSFVAIRNWVSRHCQVCGVEFWVIPSTAAKGAKFCSYKCCGRWRSIAFKGEKSYRWSGNHSHKCPICGKVFRATPKANWNPKFCSRKCLAANKTIRGSGENSPCWKRIEKVCSECGKIFKVKPSHEATSITCSIRCRGLRLSRGFLGEGNPCWRGGLSRLPYPIRFSAALKRKIRDRDGYVCTLCGKTEEENGERLTVHHVDYNKDNCDDSNLTAVCRSCNGKVNKNREMWTKHFQKRMVELGFSRH